VTSGEKMRRRNSTSRRLDRLWWAIIKAKGIEPAGSTVKLTRTHDALLQQLAEARAARTGGAVEAARRAVEVEALREGIAVLQHEGVCSVCANTGYVGDVDSAGEPSGVGPCPRCLAAAERHES